MRAAEELVQLDAEELNDRLRTARRELYELRFKAAVGQLDNNRAIRKTRKDIARILTVLHLRVLEPESTAPVTVTDAQEVAAEEPEAAVIGPEPGPEPEAEAEAVAEAEAKPARRTRRTKAAGDEGTAS
jgi:large subunit ribosomal protein L29